MFIDVASGSSVDWTFEDANIFFSYAVELRDQGESGFLLPEVIFLSFIRYIASYS